MSQRTIVHDLIFDIKIWDELSTVSQRYSVRNLYNIRYIISTIDPIGDIISTIDSLWILFLRPTPWDIIFIIT